MTPADGSGTEFPSSILELKADPPNGWPGAAVGIHIVETRAHSYLQDLTVSLLTSEDEAIAEAVLDDGAAVLHIPGNCAHGIYALEVSGGIWCLDCIPFEISSREDAEMSRQLIVASDLQAKAYAAVTAPVLHIQQVKRLAIKATSLYVAYGESSLARRLWEDIADELHQRGMLAEARAASTRALEVEPEPQYLYRGGFLKNAAPTPPSPPTTALQAEADVEQLYRRFARELRRFINRQLRLKDKVDDVLSEVFVNLLRYPPARSLLQPKNYLWRIAWRLVNAAHRRASVERMRMTELHQEPPDWLKGLPDNAVTLDAAESLVRRQQVRQGLALLTPAERSAILLVRLGYSYKEIAVQMSIPVLSVKNYVRRAQQTLKAHHRSETTKPTKPSPP